VQSSQFLSKLLSPTQVTEAMVSYFNLIIYTAWIEGFAIFVAVFVVAFVGSWNDYQKEI
jgi:hypothetical protein